MSSLAALRVTLERAFISALESLDPARMVHDALPPLPPRSARVVVIAAGKASLPMVKGALARWPDRVEHALAIGVSPAEPFDPRLTVLTAAHPIPDARSVAAAEEALRLASSLGPQDLLVALISGGASALLSAPPAGMSLAEKQLLVAALLERGAPIREVNLVRRHLSRVKGGRLAAAALPARTLTFLLSDVIGGEPHDIGSGPTVTDPTTVDEARAVLQRWAPEHAGTPFLDESLKPTTMVPLVSAGTSFPAGGRLRARILADPGSLGGAVAERLERDGLRTTIERPEEGDAAAVVERRLARAASLAPGEAVVIACEPTLRLPETRGRGGRAGWIALAAMRRLPEGVALLCAASDGADGSSGHGGAVVSAELAAGAGDEAIDRALAGFDDASVHAALGTHLGGAPTGHNLADVHVLARAPRD